MPPIPSYAAAATKENAVLFNVKGHIGTNGEVEYNLDISDVYSGNSITYQSFNVTFPTEMKIIHSDITGTGTGKNWNVTESVSSAGKSANFIIKTGSSSPAQLKTDLSKVKFELADPSIFPPEKSKVAVSANSTKIAVFTDNEGYVHYYEYFKFTPSTDYPAADQFNTGKANLSWFQAYNAAKQHTHQDPRFPEDPTKVMKGYLATIVSQEEQDNMYDAIAKECGWLGGTRLLYKIQVNGKDYIDDADSLTNVTGNNVSSTYNYVPTSSTPRTAKEDGDAWYWYWADGPEAGKIFYTAPTRANVKSGENSGKYLDGTAATSRGGRAPNPATETALNVPDGFKDWIYYEYFNWENPNATDAEPNSYGNPSEYCLQFAYNKRPTWNDYAELPQTTVLGYYVEYGGYQNDPKLEELGGSGITTTSEVVLPMPVTVQYRSTIQDEGNNYRQITGVGALNDNILNYQEHETFTAARVPLNLPGYTEYGYEFVGRNEDRDLLSVDAQGGISGVFSDRMQKIIFLYQPNRYTVSFNANFPGWGPADETPNNKLIYYDAPYGSLAIANRAGYTLTGWYTEGDGNGSTGGTKVESETLANITNGNHTLYAKWEENSNYEVLYEANGGVLGANTTTKTNVKWTDANFIPVNNPTREGYLFTGWNALNGKKQGVTNADTLGDLVITDADARVSLQAQWMEAPKEGDDETYKVFYHLNGANSPASVEDAVLSATNDAIMLPDAARTGYTFKGWSVANDGTGVSNATLYSTADTATFATFAAENSLFVTLEAQWEQNQYTVYYDKNDDESPAPESPYEPSKIGVTWEQAGLVPPAQGNPARPGYRYAGWNTNPDGSGRAVTKGDAYSILVDNDQISSVMLYAQWIQEKTYFVRYDLNGGKLQSTQATSIADKTDVLLEDADLLSVSGIDLSTSTSITPPVGYQFTGWKVSVNGSKLNVKSTDTFESLAADSNAGYITLQAQWAPKRNYTVNYDVNKANAGTGTITVTPATYPSRTGTSDVMWNQQFLLPQNDPAATGTNAKIFIGWNTKADGSGIKATNYTTYGTLTGNDDAITAITLYAQWEAKATYTVTYDTNGSTSPVGPARLTTTSAIVPATPPAIAPTGYDFAGWYVTDNGKYFGTGIQADGIVTFKQLAAADATRIEVQARWTPKASYQVAYDANGGSLSTGQSALLDDVKWTDDNLLPAHAPIQPGKTFLGWTLDLDGNGNFISKTDTYSKLAQNNDTVTQVTLYAKWADASFIVQYDLNGLLTEKIENRKVGYEDSNLIPNDPDVLARLVRAGYDLTGWDVSTNGSKLGVTDEDTYKSLSNPGAAHITLQAQWTPKTYTVHYDVNGATSMTPPPAEAFPVISIPDKTGASVRWWSPNLLPEDISLSRIGYTFAGWKVSKLGDVNLGIDAIASSSNVTILDTYNQFVVHDGTESITLQAQWTPKSGYRVIYDTNGADSGAIADKTGLNWNANALIPVESENPTKAGYEFIGWNITTSGIGTYINAAVSYATLAEDDNTNHAVTLYARWEEEDYQVTYEANGADSGDVPVDNAVYNITNSVTTLTNSGLLAKTGYNFIGWNTERDGTGTDYAEAASFTMQSAHVTLYAKWNAIDYHVTYVSNGALTGAVPTDSTTYHIGGEVLAAINVGGLQKPGYIFTGWNTSQTPSAVSTHYGAGSAFTMGSSNVQLYAEWEEYGYYSIHYDIDGGNTSYESIKTGVKWTANNLTPSQNPTKTGYDFVNWKIEDAIISAETTYAQAALGIDKPQLTLKAHWTPKTGYAVTYDPNGGDAGTVTSKQSIAWIDQNLLPSAEQEPTRAGYTFDGWSTDADHANGTKVTNTTTYAALANGVDTAGSSVPLYAIWQAIPYHVNYVSSAAVSGTAPIDDTVYTINDPVYVLTKGSLERPHFDFAGWATSAALDAEMIPDTFAITGDVTLYAVWTEHDRYAVTYDSGSADSGIVPEDVSGDSPYAGSEEGLNSYYKDSIVTVLDEGNLVKDGYRFVGWNTSVDENGDGTGTPYAVDATFAIGANTTLYAQWTPKLDLRIQFEDTAAVYTGTEQSRAVAIKEVTDLYDGHTIAAINATATAIGPTTKQEATTHDGLVIQDRDGNNVDIARYYHDPVYTEGAFSFTKPVATPLHVELTSDEYEKIYDGQPLSASDTAIRLSYVDADTDGNAIHSADDVIPNTLKMGDYTIIATATGITGPNVTTGDGEPIGFILAAYKTDSEDGLTLLCTYDDANGWSNAVGDAIDDSETLELAALLGVPKLTKSEFLKINQRPLVIQPQDAEKDYDGTPLTPTGIVVSGLASGDAVNDDATENVIELAGSLTAIGVTSSSIATDITAITALVKNSNGDNVTANYEIEKGTGTLTVKELPTENKPALTINLGSATEEYTGSTIETVVTTEAVNLYANHTWTFDKAFARATDPGIYVGNTSIAGIQISDANGLLDADDFAKYYSGIEINRGNFEITAGTYELEINLGGSTGSVNENDRIKVYDGEVLTAQPADAKLIFKKKDGTEGAYTLPNRYSAVVTATGIVGPAVGISPLGYEIAISDALDANGNEIGGNQKRILTADEITNLFGAIQAENEGQLEITKRAITIAPVDAAKVYDGTPLMASAFRLVTGASIGQMNLVTGQSLDASSFEYIGSIIEILDNGTGVSSISANNRLPKITRPSTEADAAEDVETIDGADVVDVTSNYTIGYALGNLAITTPGDSEVAYDTNGASSGDIATKTAIKWNDTDLLPQQPTKAGYHFEGWKISKRGDTEQSAEIISDSAIVTVNDSYSSLVGADVVHNLTLQAQWAAIDYAVTYFSNGAISGEVPVDTNIYHIGNEVIAADNIGDSIGGSGTALTRIGYLFSGWNTFADGAGTDYQTGASIMMGSDSIALYAQWTPIDYHVYYVSNGAISGAEPTDIINHHIGEQATVFGKGTLAKTGYTFVGWSTVESGPTVLYHDGSEIEVGSDNITLYAVWTDNEYAVAYDMNGADSEPIVTQSGLLWTASELITQTTNNPAANPTKVGYTFAGWKLSTIGDTVKSADAIAKAATVSAVDTYSSLAVVDSNAYITLQAQWTANDYNVTYVSNGAIAGLEPVDNKADYHIGDTVTVLENSGNLSKPGYALTGWNTAQSGLGYE
ncbi:MAG: InlB B-repeat-containing protein, partial [Clostridiales Family XIII bacterium]|nr:InlB B-repeat-containing protein [Clostridiales Family XIII bacterium]